MRKEVAHILSEDALAGFKASSNELAGQIISLLIEEMKKVENPFNAEGFPLMELSLRLSCNSSFEVARQAFIKRMEERMKGKEFLGMKYPFKECARPRLFKLRKCLECSVRIFCEAKDKEKMK